MAGKGVVRRLAEAWAGFGRWYRRRQEALREFIVELRELAPWLAADLAADMHRRGAGASVTPGRGRRVQS